MVFDVVQVSKDLFSACFEILCGDQPVGQMSLQGSLGSMEGGWDIRYNDKTATMEPGSSVAVETNQKVFRPYTIHIGSDAEGMVFQSRFKAGLFNSFDYNVMLVSGITYAEYPVGFGEDGCKCPVYAENEQIALIEKECVVYNDLHKYHITSVDEKAAWIAVIFCSYMYVNSAYKPGGKVKKSVEKNSFKTTNKILLQRYNPSFKEIVSE